jgi:3-phosphoglycerate kinase
LHPELVRPLAIATEITVAESDAQSKAGLVDEARALLASASQSLARAAAIPLPEDHRHRQDLARLAAVIENRQAAFKSAVVTIDAADVTAQRIRRAVEGTKPGS